MNKLKVLHILNTGAYSGAENVAITIIENTKSEVEGVYASLDGSIRNVLESKKIPFYAFKKLNIKNLKQIIKETKPDIIHAHDFTAGIIASLSTFHIPIINHLHNNSPWIRTFSVKSLVYGFSCLRYKKIATVSGSVMDEFIFGKLLKGKSDVLGNPIDLQYIRSNVDMDNSQMNYDIIFLGRLTEQKNPMFFLEIISQLKQTFPQVKVAMVGDGELRLQVEKRIDELQLRNNIKLFGFLNNPYIILNESRMLCIPSLWEGFGLVAVEALALGKPVVAAPVGGLYEIINENCGKLCEQKEEYVKEITNLLSDDIMYESKHIGALRRADEFDNIDNYMRRIIEIYNSLV